MLYIICLLIYGNYNLLPGIFSEKNKEVLSKYADGFELYDWFNSVAPKESLTLVGHRSYFFAEKDVIYFGIAAHLAHQKQPNLKTDQYYLNKLEKKNPNYILFYGFEENYDFYRYNFEKCTTGLVAKKIKLDIMQLEIFLIKIKNSITPIYIN